MCIVLKSKARDTRPVQRRAQLPDRSESFLIRSLGHPCWYHKRGESYLYPIINYRSTSFHGFCSLWKEVDQCTPSHNFGGLVFLEDLRRFVERR